MKKGGRLEDLKYKFVQLSEGRLFYFLKSYGDGQTEDYVILDSFLGFIILILDKIFGGGGCKITFLHLQDG